MGVFVVFHQLAGTIASARRVPRDAVLRGVEDRDEGEVISPTSEIRFTLQLTFPIHPP